MQDDDPVSINRRDGNALVNAAILGNRAYQLLTPEQRERLAREQLYLGPLARAQNGMTQRAFTAIQQAAEDDLFNS